MFRRSFAPRFFSFAEKMRSKIDQDKYDEMESLAEKERKYNERLNESVAKKVTNEDADGPVEIMCPRTSLFVPCSNVKALKKIPKLDADVFILDLEDSVAVNEKEKARNNLMEFVQSGREDGSLDGKRLIVRINSPTYSKDTMRFGIADLDACGVLGSLIEGIGIPKTSVRDEKVLRDDTHPDHSVWAFLETPQSIIDCEAIFASKLYAVAAMGLNDLSMELQLPLEYHMSTGGKRGSVEPRERASAQEAEPLPAYSPFLSRRLPLMYHMSRVVNAARAHGVHPIDGVFNDPTDTSGFLNEVLEAKRFGFSGKTLIHPTQIGPVHRVFAPTPEELEWATSVLRALAASEGGVAVVDGKMVEELHGKMAKRLLSYEAMQKALEEHKAESSRFEVSDGRSQYTV